MSRKRPISPHLTIYKPQITSLLSISHRITGVILFIAVLHFAWWITLNVFGCEKCINPLLGTTAGTVTLMLITAVLYYHLLNGIRHLFWDIGYGYDMPVVRKTGLLVILLTVALTGFTWCETLALWIGVAV